MQSVYSTIPTDWAGVYMNVCVCVCVCVCLFVNMHIYMYIVIRVFTNGPEHQGSIMG